MSITFKHKIKKQAIFYNDLVAGRSIPGTNGSAGVIGKNGPSIYFADYTPDDDYVKGILLDKIERGIFLTSDNAQQLIGISYTPGDLIITEKKYIYKLVIKDGKYDLEFLGNIRSKNEVITTKGKTDLLDGIISVEAYSVTDPLTFNLPIPSTKCMDSSTNVSTIIPVYNKVESSTGDYYQYTGVDTDSSTLSAAVTYADSFKISFGFSYFPVIRLESGSDIFNDFDFYLKIKIKIKKSLQADAYTLDDIGNYIYSDNEDSVQKNLYNIFSFHKFSEVKLKKLSLEDTIDGNVASDGFVKCYISDMTCDKLHPAGNNITSNALDSAYTYKTDISNVYPGSINNLGMIYPNVLGRIGSVRRGTMSQESTYKSDKEMFRRYPYRLTRGFLQYSKRESNALEEVPNFRSGDSAYFSGMTTEDFPSNMFASDNSWTYISQHQTDTNVSQHSYFYEYVNHINLLHKSFKGDDIDTQQLRDNRLQYDRNFVVNSEMKPFYFNKDNIYELVCVNKKTGETYNISLKKIIIS